MTSRNPSEKADWHSRWNPKKYLNQYYRTPTLPTDERAIFTFLIPYLRGLNITLSQAIDFGAGPTLHHAIALAPFASEIHLADFLPQNLAEMQKWLDDEADAHDWDVYVRGLLEIEGIEVDDESVKARKELVRARANHLLECDITNPLPLSHAATYPLVTSFYVADAVARDLAEWQMYMGNLASLVAPGGILVISAICGAQHYQVGDVLFPVVNLAPQDVEAVYIALGFDPDSLYVEVVSVPEWEAEGFNSVVIAKGQK